MQVGKAFENNKTYSELKLIASDPDDRYAFKVTNYTALDGLLSKLQQNIIQMEGEGSVGQSPQHLAGGQALCSGPTPGPTSVWLSGQLP